MLEKLKRFFLGSTLSDMQLSSEKFNVLWGIPIFASDAISSVSYAGEEILLVLLPVLALGAYDRFLPIVAAIIILLALLVFCYRQTIDAYPEGGGAYIVASDNLGEITGLVAGASLIMGYILTVAVSACAGAAAVTSAIPAALPYKALIAFFIICLLTWGNLRGIRDSSVMFGIPTYLFILTMIALIVTGLVKYLCHMYSPSEEIIVARNSIEMAGDATLILILRAFASGCTALTGVEAVSNGVPNFRDPAQKNAKKVLLAMAGFVCVIFLGVSLLLKLYLIVPHNGATVVSLLAGEVFGKGSIMFFVVQLMTVVILSLAANTAFADLPLLMALIARHGYLPRRMCNRGARLNFSNGILVLFFTASVLVFAFNGDQHLLLPLYASGVFISFFLSQLGMLVHWFRRRGSHWKLKAAINMFGSIVTGVTLIIIVLMKFRQGAYVALICIALLILLMLLIHRDYAGVSADLSVEGEETKVLISDPPATRIIVPLSSINRSFLKALNYAMMIKDAQIELYHVASADENTDALEAKVRELNIPAVLTIERTEYRNFDQMILRHVLAEQEKLGPHQMLTVVMCEIVLRHWWQVFLHNRTTAQLKRSLARQRNISVITVPYLLK